MNKIFIKEKQNLIKININLSENIKSLFYAYEYIFSKSYKYKLVDIRKNIYKLCVKNHYFNKEDNITIFNKNLQKKINILKVNKDHIFIKTSSIIYNDGYIKLNNINKIKNFFYKGNQLDHNKRFKYYNIKEDAIINYI